VGSEMCIRDRVYCVAFVKNEMLADVTTGEPCHSTSDFCARRMLDTHTHVQYMINT
jgi:hypothetical protein